MSNIKITDLNAAGSLAATDVVPVVDVSADETKKITATDLFRTLPDGTAAAPSLSFASDQDLGLYRTGANGLAISTGGTQRVTVDGSGNVTISGDLTVSGATTTVESTTVTIDDKNIELGSVASPSNTTADGGGITLKASSDKTIKWINSTGYWTFNTGIEVGGHLQIDDSNEIRIGSGQDLKIYHDGSESFIDEEGTGGLTISSGTVTFKNQAKTETHAIMTANGGVDLYHNNVEKFRTKSDGIDVTGEVQCDSLDVDGAADITGSVTLHGNLDLQDDDLLRIGTGDDLQIYHNGTNTHIQNDTGGLYVDQRLNDGDIILRTDDGNGSLTNYIACDGSAGEVRLYHYGSEKLNTKSDGIDVAGEVQCDSLDVDGTADITGTVTLHGNLDLQDNDKILLGTGDDLEVYHDANDSFVLNNTGVLVVRNTANDQDIVLQTDNGSGGNATYVRCDGSNGEVQLSHYGSTKLATKSGGVEVTGNLGIGTTSADELLHISSGTSPTIRIEDTSTSGVVNDIMGAIEFEGNDASTNASGIRAKIEAEVRGVGGQTDLVIYTAKESVATAYEALRIGSTSLKFRTNNSEVMRLDSSGRLLLGTTTEGHADADNLTIADSGNCGLTIRSGTASNGGIYFSDGTSSIAEYRGYFDYDHNLESLRIGTNAVERLRINNNGAWAIEGASNYGTSGQVLTSNGNDSPTWQTPSSAGGATAITMNDNVKINFGASNDLQIYHDSNASFIDDVGTGDLRIRANNLSLRNTSDVSYLYGNSGGAVTLYHNGSPKLATKSDGIDVTGEVQCDSLDVDGGADITGNVILHANLDFQDDDFILMGAGDDFKLHHNGSNSHIQNYTGGLYIDQNANDNDIQLRTDNGSGSITTYVLCDGSTGSTKLFHYGSEKLATQTYGIDVQGEVQCDSLDVDGSGDITGTLTLHGNLDMQDNDKILLGSGDDLEIYHDGGTSFIEDTGTGNLHLKTNGSEIKIEGASTSLARFYNGGAVELHHNGNKKLETTSNGVNITGYMQNDHPGVYLDSLDWTSSNKYMHSGYQFWQVGSAWNNSTGTFTCPVAGKYLVSADAQGHNTHTQSGASGQYANILPRKNNSNYGQESVVTTRDGGGTGGSTAPHTSFGFSVIMDCSVNDTIRVYSNHGFRTNTQNHLAIIFLG